MADLFSMVAPLLVLHRDTGVRRLMAERFPLAQGDGLIYFEPFWHLQRPASRAIHRLTGAVQGSGPWKIGDCVVRVLGCQGTDPELASVYAEWQAYLEGGAPGYPARDALLALARDQGARVDISTTV
ncbi:MAG: hypothetical protein WCZ87_11245 [Thiohalobacteraceae bacterium]